MKKIIPYILAAAAIAIAVYVMLHFFSWQEAYALVKTLRWYFFAMIIAISLTVSALKATRFFFILRFNRIRVSWIKTAYIFIASQVFTPFPAGEVGRAVLFKNKLDIEMTQIVAPVFLQALVELWTATLWVILGAILLGTQWGGIWLVALVIIMSVLSIPLLIPNKLHTFLAYFKHKGLNYGWVDNLLQVLHDLERFFTKRTVAYRWIFWLSIVLLSVAGQAVGGAIIWYIARVEGSSITFLQGAFAASVAIMIQGILTIIPGGLGVTEGGLVAVFTSFHLSWTKAVLITLLYRIVTLPLTIVIALLFLLPPYAPKLLKIQSTH
jgi:uncharacterized protein (TIRG00374 family)